MLIGLLIIFFLFLIIYQIINHYNKNRNKSIKYKLPDNFNTNIYLF